jgi:hypothetical protein
MEAVDPGPWMEKILPTFTVSSQKKTCALCELWFSVENLTGMCAQLVLPDEEEPGSTRTSTPGKKGKAKRADKQAGSGEEGHRPSDFLKSFLSPEARKKYDAVPDAPAEAERAEEHTTRQP